MFARISLIAALVPLAQATWAGCYDPSALGDIVTSTQDVSNSTDCSTYCSSTNATMSFFTAPASSNATCACSSTSPPSSALVKANGSSSCSPDDLTGTYLLSSFTFNSCSYAASTTAQYISTSNSSTTCFEECGDYPVTYIFPSAGGYNCYCAMTSNGAGKTTCGSNTFYAYSKAVEPSRSRR